MWNIIYIYKTNEEGNDEKTARDILVGFISSAISSFALSLIAAVGTPVVAAIALARKSNGKNLDIAWWIILGIFAFLSAANIVVGILQFVKRTNKPKFPAIKSDVLYENMRTELHFTDREHIKCYREVDFKVLCEKMKYIRKQFTWTGDGYKGTFLDERSKSKDFKIDDSIRKLPPQIYDIEFDHDKLKGEEVSYCVRSEVEDNMHVMQPVLSQHITSKTKKLVLVLTAPKGMVQNVKSSVFADSASKVQIQKYEEVDVRAYGDLETFEINIKNPELLHIYKLEWEWV